MGDSTRSTYSMDNDNDDMEESIPWSPVKALSFSLASTFTSVMGNLDRKAGELLGVPVTDAFIEEPHDNVLAESPVNVRLSPESSHKVDSETMAAVDDWLMWHLRQGCRTWHVKSPPVSRASTPRSRRSPLSLSSYAALARSFRPRARDERNTTRADNTAIDSLDSSFVPTLSKSSLDSDSDE